jgi:hypothetical protein
MVGDFDQIGRVQVMVRAKAGYAFGDRGSGDAAIEEEVEDAGVERDAVVGGSFAQVDGDFDGFSGLQHIASTGASEDSSAYEMVSASSAPSQTATRPAIKLPRA